MYVTIKKYSYPCMIHVYNQKINILFIPIGLIFFLNVQLNSMIKNHYVFKLVRIFINRNPLINKSIDFFFYILFYFFKNQKPNLRVGDILRGEVHVVKNNRISIINRS